MKDSEPSSQGNVESLDLRGTPCPLNFVRSKLKLQRMPDGSRLEILLDDGEPIEQVPDSLKLEGYIVESQEERDGFFAVMVQRPATS